MKNLIEHIFQCVVKTEGQNIWGAVMEYLELVELVWYFNNKKCKFMYILSCYARKGWKAEVIKY